MGIIRPTGTEHSTHSANRNTQIQSVPTLVPTMEFAAPLIPATVVELDMKELLAQIQSVPTLAPTMEFAARLIPATVVELDMKELLAQIQSVPTLAPTMEFAAR